MHSIYLAHPISGLSAQAILDYYDNMLVILSKAYNVLSPMAGKSFLRNDVALRAHGYENPVATNRAIVGRDRWMVRQADVVLIDLRLAAVASIGCVMELAWAFAEGKHTIVVMGPDNVHQHAFVIECADIIFDDLDKAVAYLLELEGYNPKTGLPKESEI